MTVRYSFVSTYPPTRGGLASFAASLRAALVAISPDAGPVIRVVDEPQNSAPPEVVGELVAGDRGAIRGAARVVNGSDLAIVQHDFGIYGGDDGADVLALLDAVRVPTVVVLHAVPNLSTSGRRTVLQGVLARAEAVVLMTLAARDRLLAQYDVPSEKVKVIPYGAHHAGAMLTGPGRAGRPIVLTWGLLGPDKGIEWGIEAIRELRALDPVPRYLVAGQTRPEVLRSEGEAYRGRLVAQVERLRLGDVVELDGRYQDAASLGRLIRSTDVVLLPYEATDQITSGVLSEAVAALIPVVATPFPHAVELLSGGAGRLVGYRDPAGMAAALRAVLTDPEVAAGMRRAAARAAPVLSWPIVARRYRELAAELLVPAGVR